MLLHGKFMKQLGNLTRNDKQSNDEITLIYQEDELFYLALDQEVERTRPIKITFNNVKLSEESKLLKKISNCSNGKDVLQRIFEFAVLVPELFEIYAEKDLNKLIEIYEKQGKEIIFVLYEALFVYEEESESYVIILKPNKSAKDKPLMSPFLA
ncbi:hypothetical protein [Bacillus sp. V5-8f]|uniref:hypothetical protein n=1 Tax=Bacillus sp. V5-8f TaxID=2053044 RepID=UPI000C7620D2|nr:hypothetical protein [Bacillus sp. V5-8f]PLT32089.1 hypothetical protein CUU64_21220 [Bacillus sp. V5-8f]